MKHKIYLFILLFLAVKPGFGQQQSLFTNILLNPYLYNPAYAGSNKTLQLNLNYRDQWVGFDGAPKTFAASGYSTFKKYQNMAAGGMVNYDQTGLLGRTSFYGSYSYHLKLTNKASISFGLSAGGAQYNVKIYNAKPYPGDKDDAFLRSDVLNAFAFDANAGLYLYSKNFYLGLSSQQMVNARIHWDNTLGSLTPLYYATTGYTFYVDDKKEWGIQPSVLARFSAPHPYQVEYSLRGIYKKTFWVGVTYRTNSMVSAMFGCTVKQAYSIGYSYDYTLNALNNYSSGSHEIVITYTKPVKKKKTVAEKVQDADEEELNKIDNSLKSNLKNKKNNDEKK